MKAITLSQPWASLITYGEKKIETRSWVTKYRGPLAIHAAKRIPRAAGSLWQYEPFLGALHRAGIVSIGPGFPILGVETTSYQLHEANYHLGCVIAVCELVGVDQFGPWLSEHDPMIWGKGKYVFELTAQERAFGDFAIGRYGWFLANVRRLPEPVPALGALGLWEWEGGGA